MSRELERVLRAIDDVDEREPRPPFEDRLWGQLQTTLRRSSAQPGSASLGGLVGPSIDNLEGEPVDDVVVEFDAVHADDSTGRMGGGLILLAAAAAALIIVAVALVLPERRASVATDPGPPPRTDGPTTVVVTIVTAEEACQTYVGSGVALADLTDATELDAEMVTRADVALTQLRASLETSGSLSTESLAAFELAESRFDQAVLEFDRGLDAQGRRTLDRAKSQLQVALAGLACLPE